MRSGLFLSLLLLATVSFAQNTPGPIEDNSFLIEEAYNQDPHVVQYISTFYRQRDGNWGYNFTNEYPVKGRRNQFSYSININRVDRATAVGDTLLNYRYQLVGMKEEDRLAISPRFSVILPTGSWRKGTGTGAVGYQFDFPLSYKLTKKLVTHWNAGTTFTPHARDTIGDRANTTGYNLGQSTIYMVSNRFNLMVENYWTHNQNVVSLHKTAPSETFLVSPGVRWAYNYKSGLQIVPGVAVPLGVGPSHGERGILLYLSFEK
ncbi:MAG TPA: hypothetical protein VGI80_07645 [Pyrinomonadaceae bacterium]